MSKNCLRSLFCASMTLSVYFAAGCGKNTSNKPEDKALEIVEQFLEAWNRGEPANTFTDPAKPIHGTDPDWQAGYRLLSFLSAEAKQSPESPNRVHCRVALSLQSPKGGKWDKEVVYDVHLGDKSVIRRP